MLLFQIFVPLKKQFENFFFISKKIFEQNIDYKTLKDIVLCDYRLDPAKEKEV